MTEPNCEGCIDYDTEEELYALPCKYSNKKGKCPCTLCIVKPMCKEYCDDYFKWRPL